MGVEEDVERLAAPLVAASGCELVDVELRPGTLRITVDRDGGVDLGALSDLSRAISRNLDDTNLIDSTRYELEVSSPGLERTLRRPAHFAAALGSQVQVRTKPGIAGDRRIEGTLREADDHGVVIDAPDLEPHGRRLAYEEIERARTVFDWKAALAGAERARRASKQPNETVGTDRPVADDAQVAVR